MKKRIVYKNPDGSCAIVVPSPKWEKSIEELAEKDVPDGRNWRIVDVSNIPQDRTYREAWTDDSATETIQVDMDKARKIHMDKIIRPMRDKKLRDLDIEQMKGKNVQEQKQTLRDIPQKYDLSGAETPEQLKAMIPDELK